MAVAYDSNINGSGNGSNSYTVSLSTGGTNRLILLFVHTSNNTALVPSASGLTFVQVGSDISFAGNGEMQIYRSFASAQLAGTVVTLTGSGNPQSCVCITTYSGTDTTGSNGSGAIGSTNTTSSGGIGASTVSITTTRPRSLVVGLFAETNSQSITAASGKTIAAQDNTQAFSRGAIVNNNFVTYSASEVASAGVTWNASAASGGMAVEVLDSNLYIGANSPGNLLRHVSVGDGESRSEVAN